MKPAGTSQPVNGVTWITGYEMKLFGQGGHSVWMVILTAF